MGYTYFRFLGVASAILKGLSDSVDVRAGTLIEIGSTYSPY